MQKILVTGAGGFIGSHFTELLLEGLFCTLCEYNSDNNIGWLNESKSHKNLSITLGDIRDPNAVQKFVRT